MSQHTWSRRLWLARVLAGVRGWLGVGVLGAVQTARATIPEPPAVMRASTVAEALKARGATAESESTEVTISVADVVENGAVVPVTVRSAVPQTDQISLLVAGNPHPWVASYELYEGTLPEIAMRIKMSQSSAVVAVVRAAGRYYVARREVRVAMGGCGN